VLIPVGGDAGNRSVAVAIHRDDGDGQFDPATDRVVRVGDTPVATRLSLASAGRPSVRVNTPTPTSTAAPPSTDATETPTAASATATDTTAASGPGVGPVGAVGAVLAFGLLAAWRRR
jgi:hypothetical protein